MTAFNVVRFKVKPGNEEQFVEAHRKVRPGFKGFLGGSLVRTGDQTFCFVGEWRTFQNIVNARPEMIAMLDEFRGMLEDLGSGLGVTDPVSGQTVVRLPAPKAAKKKKATARRRPKRAPKKKSAKKR
ncbi:MAG TPA: antibiotic biosynthesis monooxygenase [Casimicrobiaceae bacterium]|nr:antibiotic biosynthesis monooxygenase [Casimicrobiaceae bacterium]